MSRELSAMLDVEDPLDRRVHLRGVVAGLDRPLRHADDYRRFAGRLAKIVLREPVDGQTFFNGRLAGRRRRRRADRSVGKKTGRIGCRSASSRARIWKWSSRLSTREAMTNPLQQTIEALAKEKGIEPDVDHHRHRGRRATASRKYYKTNENLKTRFNPETGQVELFAVKTIVDEVTDPATEISLAEAQELYGEEAEVDMEIEFPKPTEVLGRIAAQTAKQVIFQKVREAERENIFAEYNQRIGEVVNGTVKRFENGDIIVEIGRIEAVLPRKEQSRAESYTPGDRVRAVIKGVNRSAKGPQIVLSRTDPALLIKLFEQEVPEIYDGTVMIRGAVREAGDRAKVAVYSRERDVDPVGACVGMKGTRVQAIIRELRGEKIDIVEWSEDPVAFVTNALSPAKVQRVSIVDDRETGDGSGRRGQAAVAGDRQEGPERPAGRQADRLADRHQERGREAPRGRGAVRGPRDRRRAASRGTPASEAERADAAEARRRDAPRRADGAGRRGRAEADDGRGGRRRTSSAEAARPRKPAPERRPPSRGPQERGAARQRSRNIEVTVGNCSDLQSRGTARTRRARK